MQRPLQIKQILGDLPFTVELYWYLHSQYKPWSAHFELEGLKSVLPDAVADVEKAAHMAMRGKRVFLFASLHYWIEQAATIGLILAGQGHQVSFGYLPYAEWEKPITKFDLRRQNLYTRKILNMASSVMKIVSFLDVQPNGNEVPPEILKIVEEVSIFDTQYTLQVEDVDKQHPLYQLRYDRNLQAALALHTWMMTHCPDVVIIPNGTIQEMGVAFRVAKLLEIRTVTFEFTDQRERIWLAQNAEIMSHDTSDLWVGLGDQPLAPENREQLLQLFAARKNAKLWGNFARKWQQTPTQGAQKLRDALGLDDRPVILLATNVLGDSLTLGRQVFTESMADWIVGTLKFFLDRNDVQLIIRVHPGELLTHGTSMVDVIEGVAPILPEHIHLIKPQDKTNTYDIIETVDLGLVFTTTVGLEMAMAGLPVVVAGKTHYKGHGFTHDPQNWDDYFNILNAILSVPSRHRLDEAQVELAWRYAYLFFFEFPLPFPWHILHLREDFNARPMAYVLSEEGQKGYGQTFGYLVGEKLDWAERGLRSLGDQG